MLKKQNHLLIFDDLSCTLETGGLIKNTLKTSKFINASYISNDKTE